MVNQIVPNIVIPLQAIRGLSAHKVMVTYTKAEIIMDYSIELLNFQDTDLRFKFSNETAASASWSLAKNEFKRSAVSFRIAATFSWLSALKMALMSFISFRGP